ncbi:MAG TPA: fructosamine kinase family protein [Polyangia bacterium]
MNATVTEAVGQLLGAPVRQARPLSGGDINEAYAVTVGDGRAFFVKTNRAPPPGMFAAEARGLAWLAASGAIRVPAVVAASECFLVLELIEPGQPSASFDAELGRGLATLHRAGPPMFGLDHDNFIGRLPQSNRAADRWGAFYRDERLEPQWKRAVDAGLIPSALQRSFARLLDGLDARVGPPEPPARLHGDLWGGNLMCDARGAPCLIDPAAYGGHREVDLAMMRLFGGFREATFAAYREVHPLADGHEERVHLYQLYPLLVHVNLFGGSYVASVESALRALV